MNYNFDENVFRMKSSNEALRNTRKMVRRNSAGSVTKSQQQSMDFAAQKLLVKPFLRGGDLFARRGYETVIDSIIDKPRCVCGKVTCIEQKYDVPRATIERMIDENFDCRRMDLCIKANRRDYLKSERVVVSKKALEVTIHNIESDIRQNELRIDGKIVETERVELDAPFLKFKRAGGRAYKVVSKKVEREIQVAELSHIERGQLRRNIASLKEQLEAAKAELSELLTYKIPTLLSVKEETEIKKQADKIRNARSARQFTYKVRATRDFLNNM